MKRDNEGEALPFRQRSILPSAKEHEAMGLLENTTYWEGLRGFTQRKAAAKVIADKIGWAGFNDGHLKRLLRELRMPDPWARPRTPADARPADKRPTLEELLTVVDDIRREDMIERAEDRQAIWLIALEFERFLKALASGTGDVVTYTTTPGFELLVTASREGIAKLKQNGR